MLLTSVERDAIGELVNIGFGRAANALSMLVGQRVILTAPQVEVCPIGDMVKALAPLGQGEILSVQQVFTGKIMGDAMLLIDPSQTVALVDLLLGVRRQPREMTNTDRETLAEVGNILLSAFIGSFGNLLQVHLSFMAPRLRLESLAHMIHSLRGETQNVEYALIIHVRFRLAQEEVEGYVVIILSVESLETLFQSMRLEGYLEE